MDRRTFVKSVGLSLALGTTGACAKENRRGVLRSKGDLSRVAVMTDGKVHKAGGLDAGRVKALLDRALRAALGSSDATSGLRGMIEPADVVGVKLNCLAGPPLSPTREFTDALVTALVSVGVAPGRIVFFERGERDIRKGGFDVGGGDGRPVFMGNDSRGAGYEKEISVSGQVGSCLSRILTRRISVLINVGVLKDHNLAGVGVATKNLFGLIHNPNKFHDNGCDPFVADVLAFPVVQKKLRLSLVDALTAQCHGGPGYLPGYTWEMNGILASTDPIALDRVAWDVIESKRREKGLKTLTAENRAPKWIRTAASRGLGMDDLKKIKIIREG
ncbi:MAG TPA: DUF362 domain-containing protein [Myxococcota bacterium]|nr:DUF362 domain-containing protein [Myxococcota bacterium]